MHRITGFVNVFAGLVLAWWLGAIAAGPEAYDTFLKCITSTLGYIFLIGWSATIYYHLCNGIRHLVWDAGYGFELNNVTKSGIAVLVGTVVLTIITWVTI